MGQRYGRWKQKERGVETITPFLVSCGDRDVVQGGSVGGDWVNVDRVKVDRAALPWMYVSFGGLVFILCVAYHFTHF